MMEQLQSLKCDHIGIVVRDVDKAVKLYESLGIGPFGEARERIRSEAEMWGKPVDVESFEVRSRNARMGGVGIQLMQPSKGKSFWKDFLESNGESVHHLAFPVDDVEKETAELEEKGFEVIYRVRFANGGIATFVDTRKVGGFFMEFVQRRPE